MTYQLPVLIGGGWHCTEPHLTAVQHSRMQPLAGDPCICAQSKSLAETLWDGTASADIFRQCQGVAPSTDTKATYQMTINGDARSTQHVLTV